MSTPAPPPAETFFDYYCAACDGPFCERVHLMNLALDYLDDEYCLPCLAEQQGTATELLTESVIAYIHSRECFDTPWRAFNAQPCPRRPAGECPCQDETPG